MIKQTAKQIAINTAKQIAREGSEVVKNAEKQVGVRVENQREPEKPQESVEKKPQVQDLAKMRANTRQMQELRQELADTAKQNKYRELQKRISEGEEVPLTDYTNEFSVDQMQVLRAMEESIKNQKVEAENRQAETIPQIISKRGRGMLNSFKKRNQQHVEMRQPPSG